jgi:hypothetical protein
MLTLFLCSTPILIKLIANLLISVIYYFHFHSLTINFGFFSYLLSIDLVFICFFYTNATLSGIFLALDLRTCGIVLMGILSLGFNMMGNSIFLSIVQYKFLPLSILKFYLNESFDNTQVSLFMFIYFSII